jgi:translation initiation factor 2 gamma subunit (eIF-2gamma)
LKKKLKSWKNRNNLSEYWSSLNTTLLPNAIGGQLEINSLLDPILTTSFTLTQPVVNRTGNIGSVVKFIMMSYQNYKIDLRSV